MVSANYRKTEFSILHLTIFTQIFLENNLNIKYKSSNSDVKIYKPKYVPKK